jgi:hypothetical protein
MKRTFILIALMLVTAGMAEARRGCCSHHGGVAACDDSRGRLVCRDGTYSPSCTCAVQPMGDAVTGAPVFASIPVDEEDGECELAKAGMELSKEKVK